MKIEKDFKVGIGTSTIEDVNNTNENEIRKAIIDSIKPLIKDEDILGVLSMEENVKRMVTRFEVKTELLDSSNGQIGELITIGKHTPREVVQMIQKNFIPNMDYGEIYIAVDKLRKMGFGYVDNKKGQLHKTRMKIVFRKGR